MMIIQLTTDELQNIINNSVKQALKEHQETVVGKTSNTEENDLLNVKETAKFLDLTIPTIYSKVSRGELPFKKLGKRLYFSKKELLESLNKKKTRTQEELEIEAEKYLSNL
ncbi:MAG: helix-turn-helix domain-containing protein [Cytophagales bacterium]|nr:helix-turn-helix domain-containing protein [Cytophagales bacterium]